MSDSFATPGAVDHQTPLSMGFPRKNTGVGCHVLLQGIFPIQGLNLHLLKWQEDSLPLSHKGTQACSRHMVNAARSKDCPMGEILPDDPYFLVGILLLAGTSSSRKAPFKAICLVSQQGSTK